MLDRIAKQDPGNPLPVYCKALILNRAKRLDEASAEVQSAAHLGKIRFCLPEVSRVIQDTPTRPYDYLFLYALYRDFRDLAANLTDSANCRLRYRQVDQARLLLESICQMGLQLAQSDPPDVTPVFCGLAVFTFASKQLQPIYKDFGMHKKAVALRRSGQVFERTSSDAIEIIGGSFDYLVTTRALAAPLAIFGSTVLSTIVLALAATLWIPAAWLRKRRGEQALAVPPWKEGFLARTMLAVFLPLAIAVAILVSTLRPEQDNLFGPFEELFLIGEFSSPFVKRPF